MDPQNQPTQLKPQSPITAQPPQENNFNKILIAIVGVLAVFTAIVGGIYYFTDLRLGKPVMPVIGPSPYPTQPPQPTEPTDQFAGWKTYTNTEGGYSIQYPPDWIFTTYKEKYPDSSSPYTGYSLFQNKPDTPDTTPERPTDRIDGSIGITNTGSARGNKFAQITETDFFNSTNEFWCKGDTGGGGPGTTCLPPTEVLVGGKRAMKQITHPTTNYEWSSPNDITINYYVWLGNSKNEFVHISFSYDDTNNTKYVLFKQFEQIIESLRFTN